MSGYDNDRCVELMTIPCTMYRGAVELWSSWMKGLAMLTPLGWMYGSCSTGSRDDDCKALEFKGEKDKPVTVKFRVRNQYLRTLKFHVVMTEPLKLGDKQLKPEVVAIDPPEFELGALQSRTVDVTVKFDKDFELNKTYKAELQALAVVRSCEVSATRTK